MFDSLHPRGMEVIDFNLEDAFIEYTRGPRRSLPIFATEEEVAMFRAMAIKELREIRGIAIAGVVAQCYLAAAAINPRLPPWGTRQTVIPPFVNDGFFGGWFIVLCVIVAIAIGLRQTLGESVGGTYPYLFHRPATRRWLIGTKLSVGMGAYLIGPPLAILGYGCWAATPQTHAGPFQWAMTGQYWIIWLVMTLPYLGAFLSGLARADGLAHGSCRWPPRRHRQLPSQFLRSS